MYCEDCKMDVDISVRRDAIGDYDVINGVFEFEVWTCRECKGEGLFLSEEEANQNKAPIPLETDALPEGRT